MAARGGVSGCGRAIINRMEEYMPQTLTTIPLSKLVPSKENVRKTDATSALAELIASIDAHGLLQNLTVRPLRTSNGKPSGTFEVIAGGRRLAAMKRLVKRKRMGKNFAVPCYVRDEDDPVEVSLAENVTRTSVHPADQFEAFAKLHAQGLGAEDIAARFGLTATLVAQRLKLAAVSPRLLAEYREGRMSLDQLMAFTVSDDKEEQERVWFSNTHPDASPQSIRRMLTQALVEGSDRRARFVGAKAYEAAGGTIVRDLFDEDGEGYFTDRDLLDRLAAEKLDEAAQPIKVEGWTWVEVTPETDYEHLARMGRVHPSPVELPEDIQATLSDLTVRYDTLVVENGDDPPEEIAREITRLSEDIDTLTERGRQWLPEDKARAGAVVALDPDGNIRVERGLVKLEDRRAEERARKRAERAAISSGAPLPDALVEDLTAHKTAALRAVVGENPPLALAALVHTLACRVLYGSFRGTCLAVRCESRDLKPHAAGIGESKALAAVADRHRRWQEVLPEEERLWPWLLAQTTETKLALLAHCVAATLDAVEHKRQGDQREQVEHAGALAAAARLDMVEWWAPTKDRYLGRVSKALIRTAVTEAVSPQAAENIAELKKEAMAQRAAELLSGRRWLPEILRTPAEAAPATDPDPESAKA